MGKINIIVVKSFIIWILIHFTGFPTSSGLRIKRALIKLDLKIAICFEELHGS